MQTCPQCGAQQLDGTIFCSECGDSLLAAKSRGETTASLGAAMSQIDLPIQPTVVPEPVLHSTGYRLSLVVINSGRRLTVDMSEERLIGRTDRAKGIVPDIDLGPDGGYDAGVSRRHAILALQRGMCVVEDLNSANGTYVNGQRVLPHEPTPLRHGDELKFGTLLLRVEPG